MQNVSKTFLFFVSTLALFISALTYATSAQISPIKPKIVGGEIATEGDWPWMSALVYTFNETTTTLSVDNINYDSQAFSGGVAGTATGVIVDCGIGDNQCDAATGNICLIERGDINFSVKVENCQAGGGIGAIIYNNEEGLFNGTLGDDFTGSIPALAITQADGAALIAKIGSTANLSVSEGVALAQSSTCGASFLGDKWLLTAAHCVDGVSAQQLKVNVGEYDLSNGAEDAQSVERIYMHPNYELDTELNNDIALIELTSSVNNEAVTLINLEQTSLLAMENSTATVTGWGGREGYAPDGGPTSDFPDVLHQVDLQLMTNDTCKSTLAQSYSDLFGGNYSSESVGVTDAMICAAVAGGGKGSCQGDSGGPLMVNTNEGWQQIGIVSWGVGCAADGFPGVYTRSALFIEWINEITQGVAIEQHLDYGFQAQNSPQSSEITLTNNSQLSVNLTYLIDGDANFTIASNTCNIIDAGANCQLTVSYDAAQVGKHNATLVITADNNDILTSSSKLTAQTIAVANTIKTQLSNDDDALSWYSGGDNAWQLDNTEAAIVSGVIANNQESAVMLVLSGEGELSFEWAVSSEENTEDADSPYDALYLYLDNELIKFISGDVSYTSETIAFTEGDHRITWLYAKDAFTSEGDDNAHIRNIVFTPTVVTTPTPAAPVTTSTNARSSSGGAVFWPLLILLILVNSRRSL